MSPWVCLAALLAKEDTVTAHAGGGDEYIEPTDQWEGLEEPTPTTEPGVGFSDEGNLVTRDLLYDEHTNKQFITVQTSGGNTFYTTA